ncbi:SLC13 family permease [Saccharopolyspora dendranthemae]|uniref:UIT1 family transporter n=1 Tax=Saccharopolyspora dendranthemae TaxID=1181886 RepID=A0A561V8R0_9PSEU|nr:SLC13 family permease [Saccharopolyspora dendranthemae]TWG08005.1 UIT1 family transporter [Saccharopolyspora dendranthemae]
MPPEVVSILVLVAAFIIATTLSVNMGVLCFAAAFLVATVFGGLSEDDIFDGFPGDLFVVLVGVTFLFAIARANGTTDWVVQRAVRLVGGRIALIPWVMFGIGAVLTAIGAVSPAAVAIVAPIALNLAARYRINPLLMGAMVVHGTQAGGFSPISIYGSIVNEVVANSGLPGSPMVLFLGSFAANAAIAGVVFVVFGGLRLRRASEEKQLVATGSGGSSASSDDEPAEELRLNRDRALTLTGLAVLVVTTLGFGLDVGLVAMSVAVVLSVLSPKAGKAAPSEVAWPTVLLICGVLTYVGVLEKMGTIDYVGHSVAGIGVPLLAALLLCYIGAIVSAFASSVGIMGALIPLAVPFLQTGSVGPIGMITAFAVAATVVDVSPFSTNGAIVLANAKDVDKEVFFRKLLVYGGVIVAAAPLAMWVLLVLPGFG